MLIKSRRRLLIITSCSFIAALLTLMNLKPASAAVTLVYFRAAGSSTQISLEWETASEIDMVGFYILKSGTLLGDYEPISTLIYSLGDSFGGATYSHADSSVTPGQTYYYKLQVVDRNQNSEYFGPIIGYAGTETLTPTLTNTLPPAITTTPSATSSGTISPTLTRTSISPTRTYTPNPLPTTTMQVLASTRTATITIIPSEQIRAPIPTISEISTVDIPTATNSNLIIIMPGKTVSATISASPQTETQNSDIIGWLLVGAGGSGLFIGAGWIIWVLIQQKSSKK